MAQVGQAQLEAMDRPIATAKPTYTKALEQFRLDGTGVILGLVLGVAGLFARANF